MPQSTAQPPSQPAKLTKKQRKGLAFRQKLGKRKSGKLEDLESEHAPIPESDIIHDEEGLGESENIDPNADSSSSDRRRNATLKGKAQQQRQDQKQSRGEGDVKTRDDGEIGARTQTEGTGSATVKFTSGTERPSKKRKRLQVELPESANLDPNTADSDAAGDAPLKPKKRKRKLSEDDAGENDANTGKNSGSSKQKTRYILFVGNLKYTTTKDAIQAHFSHIDPPPTIRLLTPKASSNSKSSTASTKSKGCAFLEFASRSALQSALKLHHSTLDARQINVELTAGGGGKSSKRLEKLKGRNAKLEVQRKKRLQKSTDPSSNPSDDLTSSTTQRHSSTSGDASAPPNKKRTWSIPEAGDENTTHRGGKKHHKQRGVKKRDKGKDKNLGTGVNAIPVG